MQDRPNNEDSTTNARQVAERPRYNTFQNLDTILTRGETALKMIRDFSQCGIRDLASRVLQPLSNTSTISVMDLYDRPAQEATRILIQRFDNIEVQERRVPEDVPEQDACLQNLRQMSWTIEPGKTRRIELLTRSDRVIGVRTLQDNVS